MKTALITGITGQDGSYLAELLLSKGYEVHGIIRRSSSFNTGRIDHIFDRLHLHHGDITDGGRIAQLVHKIKPDEVYNLAAQSHVQVSFEAPHYTSQTVYLGALNVFEACRSLDDVRVYQASSSEMYGEVLETPQTETTPWNPVSPYAVAKVAAHNLATMYREQGIWIACGILFNHESERRLETFVTRKITRAAMRIKLGLQDKVYLGNLHACRDWGYAPEYVEAMWRMLQVQEPDDFVIATGQTHTVRQFLDLAWERAGLEPMEGVGIDSRYFRPCEVHLLKGDPAKAKAVLGWEPKTNLEKLVAIMVDAETP